MENKKLGKLQNTSTFPTPNSIKHSIYQLCAIDHISFQHRSPTTQGDLCRGTPGWWVRKEAFVAIIADFHLLQKLSWLWCIWSCLHIWCSWHLLTSISFWTSPTETQNHLIRLTDKTVLKTWQSLHGTHSSTCEQSTSFSYQRNELQNLD